jgi:hypothetical protein
VGDGAAAATEGGEVGSRAQCVGHGSGPAGRGRIPGERRSRQRGGRRLLAARVGGRRGGARSEESAGAVKAEGEDKSAPSPDRAKNAAGPEETEAEQRCIWDKLAQISPAGGPACSRGSKAIGKENSSSSWPWRRASSETMKLARRDEATVSRNMLQPISRTSSFSKRDPSQNCSDLETKERDAGWAETCLAAMCTDEGANSGEPGFTGVHTRVPKLCRTY